MDDAPIIYGLEDFQVSRDLDIFYGFVKVDICKVHEVVLMLTYDSMFFQNIL